MKRSYQGIIQTNDAQKKLKANEQELEKKLKDISFEVDKLKTNHAAREE